MEREKRGLTIERYFSEPYGDVYEDSNNLMKYSPREALITDDQGKVVEQIKGCIFPEWWSQHSVNTVASKYLRKVGVPETGRETDIRQITGRVAKKTSQWGVEQGYFNEEGAKKFEQELAALTIGQYGAFNSPVWFSLGLDLYGIKKDGEGFYMQDGKPVKVENYYEHPQVSACFISSPKDSILSMMQVAAMVSSTIFKGGSGIGGDWSAVRGAGEPISGGGVASGSQRFQDVQDSVARVIKSGGTTRRAATNQSMKINHLDIMNTIKHKYISETKARILVEAGSSRKWESHTIQDLRGQNVNINIRTYDAFWEAYEKDLPYKLKGVVSDKSEEIPARKLAKIIAFANHDCGDPNMQYHDTINRWDTCPESGEINASNPCSEFNGKNDSACNLASLNVMKFRKTDGRINLESLAKAVDVYITAQDIFVSKASYPTEDIAINSDALRPLGLGYANLGACIMSLGLAYDSDEARDFAAALTSYITAEAYLQSSKLAENLGAFKDFEKNKDAMLNVLEMHRKASKELPKTNGLEEIVESANKKWNEVIERGKKYGYRNSQVTLLAPTGTIGFMMGCDTTGGEPEFQLKKYKELSGGGSMIIVNETVPLALERLGYNSEQIEGIKEYIDQNGNVEKCGILKAEHLSVFDCAAVSGEGTRAISPMGHIKMLSAIQPFLSGAISKTVNCPETTSVEEIESMFYQAWKMGVKAVAIYRDGCKVAQPLKTKKSSKLETLTRGEREPLPNPREGITEKVKIGNISYFIRSGEYKDGRLGELFLDSLERGTDINRLVNLTAIQFSEKLQVGVNIRDAIDVFQKAGQSQIAGLTNHPFIKGATSQEDFLYKWISAHYLGDISFIPKTVEMRPLPWELRIYSKVPKLHLMPTVEGEKMYPGVPSLEETIEKVSGTNFWCDVEEGLDTRETIERIKRTRVWGKENFPEQISSNTGKLTGRICEVCGSIMIPDGNCSKCPKCKTSTGGCGGG